MIRLPFIRKDHNRTEGVMPCVLVKSDGNVVCKDVEKRGPFLIDHQTRQAWAISKRLRRKFRGGIRQIIYEDSCAPQGFFGVDKWVSTNIIRIVQECYFHSMYEVSAQNRRDIKEYTLIIIAGIVFICIAVMMIGGLYTQGKLHLP